MTTIIGVDDTSSRSRYARNVSTAEVPVGHDIETAFVRGDEDALRLAYDEYGRLVYSFCARSLDPERAKDVTQEVFLSAWRDGSGTTPRRAVSAHG